jgi:hypothetical protein
MAAKKAKKSPKKPEGNPPPKLAGQCHPGKPQKKR